MTVQITKLPGGLTVATDRLESVDSVSLGVWVGVGQHDHVTVAHGIFALKQHVDLLLEPGISRGVGEDDDRAVDPEKLVQRAVTCGSHKGVIRRRGPVRGQRSQRE